MSLSERLGARWGRLFDVSHLPERAQIPATALMRFFAVCAGLCTLLLLSSPFTLEWGTLGRALLGFRFAIVVVVCSAFMMARRGKLLTSIWFAWGFATLAMIVNMQRSGGLMVFAVMTNVPLILFTFLAARRAVVLSGAVFTTLFLLVHLYIRSQPDAPPNIYESYSAMLTFTMVMLANTLITYLASRHTTYALSEIEESIGELRQEQEQEQARRSEAEEASARAELSRQAKDRFLANMSHELRTPLGAIVGYAELIEEQLEESPELDPLYLEDATRIRRSSQHLLWLINDILDLSRIDAGRMPTLVEPITVAQLVALVQARLAERVPDEALLQVSSPPATLATTLNVDSTRLAQLLAQQVLAMATHVSLEVEVEEARVLLHLRAEAPEVGLGEEPSVTLSSQHTSTSIRELRQLLRDAVARLLALPIEDRSPEVTVIEVARLISPHEGAARS